MLQAGVRQLDLTLNAARPDEPEAVRGLCRVAEQRRLAETGLAADEQSAARALADAVEQAVDDGALFAPAEQRRLPGTRRGVGVRLPG